ncbi:MAG: hypothetical protein FWG65_10520 [Turicibacter sp.]|nr:hypothetical protein [Turicibacter sp.]
MIIQKPKRYTYSEMEKEFDGQCVCVIDCERDETTRFLAGRVVVADPSMDNVYKEARTLKNQGLYSGSWAYKNFAGFGDFIGSGIVEVISYEDD